MAAVSAEREVKLGAWAGFSLPDLDGVGEGITVSPLTERVLKAVYYDTADLRLARWGVTVRHRTGEGTGWTVKLPEGSDGPALVRREVTFDGPPNAVPADALGLVRAYVRRESLSPVAHMRTRRSGVVLSDVEGQPMAEVVDDEVSVLQGGRVATRFREVEVEVEPRAAPGLLDTVVDRLREAGAGQPDPTPKLVRALGARALAPPELAPVPLDGETSAGDAVRAAMVASVTRVLRHDPGVRIGDDPKDVHQARVGTRRLRSDLRTFAPLLVDGWSEPLRQELAWFADLLGGVRDADVMSERLRRQAHSLPEHDAAGLAPLFRRLAKQRDEAVVALGEGMAGERYVDLLDRLVAAARDPRLLPEADEPAAQVLPALAGRPWRHLRKTVESLPSEPADVDLHTVRIRAKRMRYAAEAVAPVVGKPARSFARAVADLQTVLGDHQDAVVAEDWLRHAVSEAPTAQALAAGELIGLQRAEKAACRAGWTAAWKRVDKKKRRSWLG